MTKARAVLMLCPQFRPLVGGAERQAEKLARALAGRGLRVSVLTPRLVQESASHEEDGAVTIHRFPLLDLCKQLPGVPGLGPLNLLSIQRQVHRAVRGHLGGVDVLHAHIASPLSAFAVQAAQSAGVPSLCKMAMAGERNDLSELSSVGLGGARIARQLVRRLDCFVATTDAVRESLREWNVAPDAIAMIPNGVDVPEQQPERLSRGKVLRFLYLGRLSSNIERDVPSLVRAFDAVADAVPDAELAIVGDGDLFASTVDLVSRARNRERIRMPGLQPPQAWFDWADCLVLPSRREGLSNALLEAMSNGLPCIANDIPSNREVLDGGKAGLLVPVGAWEQLRAAMTRVAGEPELARSLGRAALDRARTRYSIDAVADQYIALYERLLQRASRLSSA